MQEGKSPSDAQYVELKGYCNCNAEWFGQILFLLGLPKWTCKQEKMSKLMDMKGRAMVFILQIF